MKTAVIMAECNPFHTRHAKLFAAVKEMGYDALVVLLSGNFVQRGDVALFDKWTRTRALIGEGADLVLEVPVCSVLNAAQHYAEKGVYLARALGCCDAMIFGSECGDLALLDRASRLLETEEGRHAVSLELAKGKAYPRAVSEGLSGLLPDGGASLFSPNNILGMEYLRSGRKWQVPFSFATIRRFDCADGELGATDIRRALAEGDETALSRCCTNRACHIFEHAPQYALERNEKGVLTVLRTKTKAEFAALAGWEKGMEQHLFDAAQQADSLQEFFALAKTKRYALSRLRRMALCAFLQIDSKLSAALPPYLRLLGMTDRGEEVLAKADCALPISPSLARLERENALCGAFAAAEARSTELARLFGDRPLIRGAEYTMPLYKEES